MRRPFHLLVVSEHSRGVLQSKGSVAIVKKGKRALGSEYFDADQKGLLLELLVKHINLGLRTPVAVPRRD